MQELNNSTPGISHAIYLYVYVEEKVFFLLIVPRMSSYFQSKQAKIVQIMKHYLFIKEHGVG